MLKLSIRLVVFGLAVLVGSCTGVPVLNVDGPTVAQIIDRIQCEIITAADTHPKLRQDNWAAAVDLTLQVDDSAGLTPTVNFIRPLVTEGTNFAFGASAALKGSRQRIYAESLDIPINSIKPRLCHAEANTFGLTGTLGIIETVDLGMGSIGPDDGAAFKKDKAFGETIQFAVTRNVSAVGPAWTLVHFTGPGGIFGTERIDTHQLIIAFAPGAAGTKRGVVAFPDAAVDRARDLNSKMLLKSLPVFRSIR